MPGGISGDADRSTLYALARKKFSEAPPSSWRSAGSSRSDGSGGRAAPKPTSAVGLETLAEAENVSSPSSQSRMRKRASSIAWVEVDEEKISPKLGARALNEVFFMLRGWVLQSVLALLFTYLSYRVAKLGFQSATAVFCSRISYEVAVFILLMSLTSCKKQNEVPSYLKEYEDAYAENPRAAALQWFKEAKFGMFIHYG